MGGVTPMTEEEIKENMNPWWKKAVTGIVIGASAVAAILVGVYVFFEISNLRGGKASGAKEEASGAPDNAE